MHTENRKTLILTIGVMVLGSALLILWQTSFWKENNTGMQEVVSTTQSSAKITKQREEPVIEKEPMVFQAVKPEQETEELQEVDDLIEPEVDETLLPSRLGDLTTLGHELDTHLEENEVGYLNTSFYPFDIYTEKTLRQYVESGRMMLFDNTESKDVLQGHGKDSSDLVSQFYGVAEPAEVILGTSVKRKNGSIEYMVLAINKKKEGQLIENVKVAIDLLQQEKAKKSRL